MKRVLGAVLSSLLGLLLLTADIHAGPKDHWKIGHVRPKGASIDTDARKLAGTIAGDTKGEIVLDVVPESGLGDYSIVTELVSLGNVEMFIGPFGTMVDKRAALPLVPYLVTNWTEAKRVFGPGRPMLTNMGEIMEKQNIKILGGWPVYFGGIALKKEPPNPGNPDIPKGLLLRTPPIVSFELTVRAMGYRSYPITWAYARAGLKTGMVDGLLGGGAEGYADLQRLAKYYLPVKDHFEYWFVYMNLDLWKGLSAEGKAAFRKAVEDMERRRWDVAEAEERACLDQLRDQGVKIITLDDAELAKTMKKVREQVWPFLKENIGEAFDEVVESVRN